MIDNNYSWRPLTTASPELSGPQVQLDSPLARSRVKLHRDALVYLLAGKQVPDRLRDDLAKCGLCVDYHDNAAWPQEDLELWQQHGWGLSLSTYAWSRAVKYHDTGPKENQNRANALQVMLAERPCPMPPVKSSFSAQLDPLDGGELRGISDVLADRRSVGAFRSGEIKKAVLDMLLRHGTHKLRECRKLASDGGIRNLLISVGSAIDIYAIVFAVGNLHPGVYRYEPESSIVTLQTPGEFQKEVYQALAGQPDPTNAAATLVFVADFDRYQWRYRHERALRNLYIEAGRIMQPMILTATALTLRTGITPAIQDCLIGQLLGLDTLNFQALYTLTVGV